MMSQRFKSLLAFTLMLILTSLLGKAWAETSTFTIGYLEQRNDPRYRQSQTYARFLTEPLGRPFPAAEVALNESRFHAAAAKTRFQLERQRGRNAQELTQAAQQLYEQGTRFMLVDASDTVMAELAAATRDLDLILFNVSSRADALRQAQCQANLFHTMPNDAMLSDALAQYLVSRKWNRVLVLEGPTAGDKGFNEAFERSAKRYGLRVMAKKTFEMSNDPRNRSQNNTTLLTSGVDYDVVFVSDSLGEFARAVPYQTQRPQIVVGSEGLAAAAWHWAWERHGAPQLEKRFQDYANRPMRDVDWAAWMAVKALAEAVQRTKSTDFATLKAYLLSDELVLDGFKGNRLNFRPWDRQLRQPVLLVTHNWVVERAPIKGFLHQTNNLDSIGFDERDSVCGKE